MTKSRRWLSFLAGMFTGTFLVVITLAGLIYFCGQQIWLLRINTYEVTDKLEGAVELMAAETLPQFIEHIKPRIPEMVAENVSPQFAEVKFQLGGEEFSLPAELADRLEANYRANLIISIEEFMDSLPLEEMGEELSRKATEIVENAIYAEFNTRLYDIALADFFSVPVRIELMNQPGEKSFRLQLTAETRPRE
ncbi:MAG: hypothetical protein ACOX21_07370 [Bacillota bacterium]|jgi:hypothetical protein|nr:hypothetical protein [Bacillota bacterium]HOC05833.1 hypothetical protein [Bacillota bacterium]HPZ21717.1 hypothetical protein [Bacillota bacterium]HQD19554.1 hypothetical protein [Bacillota bacterium]